MILNSGVKCTDECFITQRCGVLYVGYPALPYVWSLAPSSGMKNRENVLVGTQNAALDMNGKSGNSVNRFATIYNGSTWSVTGGLSCSYCLRMGAGNTNAAVLAGGRSGTFEYTTAEEFNGSSFSVVTALPAGRFYGAMAGTQNAGILVGGCGNASCNDSLEYNGSTWSAGGNSIYTNVWKNSAAGTQNAALSFSSGAFNICFCTQEYNGSSWSAGGALPVCIADGGGGNSQNDSFGSCRATNNSFSPNKTYKYNGSTWSLIAYHPQFGSTAGMTGTTGAGLSHGGSGTTLDGTPASTTTSELSSGTGGVIMPFSDNRGLYVFPPS